MTMLLSLCVFSVVHCAKIEFYYDLTEIWFEDYKISVV